MANLFESPDMLASLALGHLYERTMFAGLVHQDLSKEFGDVGDTVNIRIPAKLQSNTYDRNARTINKQDVTEAKTPVVIDQLETVDVEILSEDWALEPVKFADRVLKPAAEAIAQKVDTVLAAAIQTGAGLVAAAPLAAGGGTIGVATGAMSDPKVFAQAGKILNDASAPSSDRIAVMSNAAEANVVVTDDLRNVSNSGSTAALREAQVGRLYGIDTFRSGNNPDDETLVWHRSAVAFVQRALPVPPGAKGGVATRRDGMSIRVIYDYDMDRKSTIASFDVLFGTKILRPELIVTIGS